MASFDGGAALIYKLTAWPKWSEKDIISFKFKTMRSSGMLLHAEGQQDHCLSLMLDKGRLLLYHQHGGWIYYQHFNMCEKAKTNIQFIHRAVVLNAHFPHIDWLLKNEIKFSMVCDWKKIFLPRNDQALLMHPVKCKSFGHKHEDERMTRKLEFFYEPGCVEVMLERRVWKSMLFCYQLFDSWRHLNIALKIKIILNVPEPFWEDLSCLFW